MPELTQHPANKVPDVMPSFFPQHKLASPAIKVPANFYSVSWDQVLFLLCYCRVQSFTVESIHPSIYLTTHIVHPSI
jgi:hypothetical protein